MAIVWFVVGAVCAFISGFHYGRLIGIDVMLHLGEQIYPDFKDKVVKKVMKDGEL